jgi:hypothetical protein
MFKWQCVFLQESRARKVRSNKLNKSLSGDDIADDSINNSLNENNISLGENGVVANEEC